MIVFASLCLAARAQGQAEVLPAVSELLGNAQQALTGGGDSSPTFTMPLTQPGPVRVTESRGLISLSVRGNASLRQVLSAIAQTQGLNLVIAAPAEAVVTAEFKEMPLGEVLSTLLESTGHTLTRRGNVYVVTDVALGGVLDPGVQGRRVAVIELDFASAADLQPAIQGLLSPVGKSHFIETAPNDNRRAKELLIVEDLDAYVARIEHYVAQADQAPRQVLIEVNLLQVELTDDDRRGVDFRSIGNLAGAQLTVGTSGLAGAGQALNTGVSNLSANTPEPGFFIQTSAGSLDAVIEALITTNEAKTIASPRLIAVNGQESRIQVGRQIGYETAVNADGVVSSNIAYLDVGVILSVTPRITRDGRVLLNVAPEVSSEIPSTTTNAPNTQTTNLSTNALLSSGQGMIIGGLIQEDDTKRVNRLPVLGSLPYVNALFQRRETRKLRSELIIALSPHVLPYADSEVVARQQSELGRVKDPLLDNRLCRQPRPYEPRLYDPYYDEKRWRCLDRKDECDDPYAQGAPVCPAPGPACGGVVRRLPPITPGKAVEIATYPQTRLVR